MWLHFAWICAIIALNTLDHAIADCPTSAYVRISDCSSTNDYRCPENSTCFNESCCALQSDAHGTGITRVSRCPGSGKHSSGRCKRQACGRLQICVSGYCCPSASSYTTCPNTGYVSTSACGSGCGSSYSCQSGYCCPSTSYMNSMPCPDGSMSMTRCYNNACPGMYANICYNGFCCPTGGGYGDSVMCPQFGVVSRTRCINNICLAIPSQICYQGFCCPSPTGGIGGGFGGIMCPSGAMATTPCINGMCTAFHGQMCYQGYCCPQDGFGGGSIMCPLTNTMSRTPCSGNVCTAIPGLGCHAGFCCPMTSSVTCPSGMVSTTACQDNVCVMIPGQMCVSGFCCPQGQIG